MFVTLQTEMIIEKNVLYHYMQNRNYLYYSQFATIKVQRAYMNARIVMGIRDTEAKCLKLDRYLRTYLALFRQFKSLKTLTIQFFNVYAKKQHFFHFD